MANPPEKVLQRIPSFAGRLLVASIVFLLPTAILAYAMLVTPYVGFISSLITGYLTIVILLIAYLLLVKVVNLVRKRFKIYWMS